MVPAVGRSRVLHASPSPPQPGAAAPPAARGTRGQHTPFCYPTGAHVGQPGTRPARFSRSRLGSADPSGGSHPSDPAAPAPEVLAGWGLRAGAPAQPREVASGASSRSGAAPEIPDFSSTPPRHGTDGETEVHSVAATRPRSPCARGLEPGCATSRWEARGTAQVGRGEARRAPAPLPRQRPSLTSCRRARSLSSRAPPPLRTWPRPSVRPAPRPPRSPLRPGRPLRVAAAATTS